MTSARGRPEIGGVALDCRLDQERTLAPANKPASRVSRATRCVEQSHMTAEVLAVSG